jgi:ABC-type dipeptide/oligopeptide/nickel transport system permease component
MSRYILRRLAFIPLALIGANFLGYAYAFYVGPVQSARNPYSYGGVSIPPLIPEYLNYLSNLLRFDLGAMPHGEAIWGVLLRAGAASLWLLGVALVASLFLGLFLGFNAVRTSPSRISIWLTGLVTIGLAAPSYYIGMILIALSVVYVIWGPGTGPLLPFQGYGLDLHLILPIIALMVLPTVKIAQITAGMLVGELDKQYVVAAKSFGHTQETIRGRLAFRNIIAPVTITVAAALRLMVAELIIVERLFDWPGIGRLFSSTLVLTTRSDNFLFPPLVAALLTMLALLFLLVDFISGILVRHFDPRQVDL